MKKVVVLCGFLILVLFFTGCSKKEVSPRMMVCTKEESVATGLTGEYRYEVIYENDYVMSVNSIEKIIAEEGVKSNLSMYKEAIENAYEPYKEIEYYNYEVTIDDNILLSKVDIDYSKIDVDKMIAIDNNNSALLKNGKIKIEDMRSYYESYPINAICKK